MSKKRAAETQNKKGEQSEIAELNELEFEDPYGDEYDEDDEENEEKMDTIEPEGESSLVDASAAPQPQVVKQVWKSGVQKLEDIEDLEYDPSAYIMYHAMQTEWPCLSFDFLKDDLGDTRHRFPLTMFMVTGSQADRADKNKITLLKVSDLNKTHVKAESDDENSDEEEDDDDEGLDDDPTIEHMNINHHGGVNRIRSMPQSPGVIATMSDTGKAHIYDLTANLASMMGKGPRVNAPNTKPAFTYSGHQEEGYALAWNPLVPGRLATGDCAGKIRLWNPSAQTNGATGSWQVDNTAYSGHTASVEDLQWSPSEATVLSSASADRTVRIWDIRDNTKPQITFDAHSEDVNVISWNHNVAYLLASGCDDGSFKVWDLRAIRKGCTPLAHFTYHTGAVTSIEWAPHDESVIALCSADNQLTVWDLSVEADDAASQSIAAGGDPALSEYPPQLLFIHQGQFNMKELHFHPQIPGAITSTAENGFNVFKPAITVSS